MQLIGCQWWPHRDVWRPSNARRDGEPRLALEYRRNRPGRVAAPSAPAPEHPFKGLQRPTCTGINSILTSYLCIREFEDSDNPTTGQSDGISRLLTTLACVA